MGVFTLQLLACGQLILLSLGAEHSTAPNQIESSSKMTSTSQIDLKTTQNYTVNNFSTPSSNLTQNSTDANMTIIATSTRPQNMTNETISNSTLMPKTTTTKTTTTTTQIYNTTQTKTSAPTTTVNIGPTASTSPNKTTYSTATIYTTLNPSTKTSQKTTTAIPERNSTDINKSSAGLSNSEKSLTVLFSALLGLIVLMVLVYFMHKYRKRKQTRVQYTHRRLQSNDTGEQFDGTDDTLVISGGLYDGPQIYNPTMTVQNEDDFHTDASGFGTASTQFRLEFLKEDQQGDPERDASTFYSFHASDQEP